MLVRVCFAFCILTAIPCTAQWVSLPFERLTIENGLPSPSVLDILEDRQGFMWFGTLSGIVRYDGYQMTVYQPAAVPLDSLPEREVYKLYQDKSGTIWAGLMYQKAKLFRYDPRTDRFVPFLFNPTLPAEKQAVAHVIASIAEDKFGRLVVGSWSSGLSVIDMRKAGNNTAPVRHYLAQPGNPAALPSNDLWEDMAADATGNVWITTSKGVCKFTPGSDHFTTYTFSTNTSENANACHGLYFETPNRLWVGTAEEGLLLFDTKTENFIQRFRHEPGNPFSLAHNEVNKIVGAKDGKLWLCVHSGCDIFDPETRKFEHVKDRRQTAFTNNFPGNNALICDYSGNIWMATWQTGIYKFSPDKGQFRLLRPSFYQNDLQSKYPLTDICQDAKGTLWIGTEGDGLVGWNRENGTFRHFRHQPGNPNSLSGNNVDDLIVGKDGFVWIGTDKGLDRLDPVRGGIRHYQPYSGGVVEIWCSRQGAIWSLCWGSGLSCLRDPERGVFDRYPDWDADTINGQFGMGYITAYAEDDRGKLYFGINQWGLYIYDPQTGTFEHFLEDYGVHDIHFDRHGQCWLTTHSGGLKLWDRANNRLLHLDETEHKKIGIAREIQEDADGLLWIKTPRGIVQFDPVSKRVRQQFSARSWLNLDEPWFNGYGSYKSPSGELFYTSPSGIVYFHPQRLRADTIRPKIALTALRVLNEYVQPGNSTLLQQHISQTKSVRLEYWQNDIRIEFSALHFKTPEENHYRYFLENYDRQWQNSGTAREASYTHLSPGHYVFRVQAINSDGVPGATAALNIRIFPPWWATWWAYLVYILAAAGFLWALRRYELKRKLAQAEAERLSELDSAKTRFFTNITHEFRTPLTIILGLADQLKAQASASLKTGLDIIGRNGQQLLRLVNQILELAKAESGHLHLEMVQGDVAGYLRYLLESFQSLAKSRKISLQLQSARESIFMDYDPERLQFIVSNLLSNALKFTPPGGQVVMALDQVSYQQQPMLQLQVRDTGPGIAADKLPHVFDRFYQADDSATRSAEGAGIGLALTRELVRLMGGKIIAASEVGKGACFTVWLPIQHAAPAAETNSQLLPKGHETSLADLTMPAPDHRLPASSKALILLVEDNRDVVHYLRSCLDNRYHIAVAFDGQQGIDRALELIPDLIISDVMMPHKDGFEVCHTLKTDARTSHIPVVLLTAKADITSKITGLQHGADAYLPKPFHREELLAHIVNLLEVRRKLQAYYLSLAGLSTDASLPDVLPDLGAAHEKAFLDNVKAVIEADWHRQWTVPELADALFVSVSQLHRKLRALSGMHTTQFVRHVRLMRASAELRTRPDDKISSIAYEVGFSNAQEFTRRFKEVFGVTPAAWRQGDER